MDLNLININDDCLLAILNLLTVDDLENVRKTCKLLSCLIIDYKLIPKRCPIRHFDTIKKFRFFDVYEKCNQYQCCKYYIDEYIHNPTIVLGSILQNAVYNEWYDLIGIIINNNVHLKYNVTKKYKNYRFSYIIGIAIERGSFKLLNALFPNGQKLTPAFMYDRYIEWSAIKRIVYSNNFDMLNYLKDLNLITNQFLERIGLYYSVFYLSLDYFGSIEYSIKFHNNRLNNCLPLENLEYLIKFYCENIDIQYARNATYNVIKCYFPKCYDIVHSRIQQNFITPTS